MSQYDWHMERSDHIIDACLNPHKNDGSVICDNNTPWENIEWLKFGIEHDAFDETHVSADGKERLWHDLVQDGLSKWRAEYFSYLKKKCAQDPFCDKKCANEACDDHIVNDVVLKDMCKKAHHAELILDEISVLGVGCPMPKARYIPPPKPPCWANGDVECPDEELEKCDVLTREMRTITSEVKLTSDMAKCFSLNLKAPTSEKKLAYYCIAKGVYEEATNKDVLLKDLKDDDELRSKVHFLGEAQYHKVQGNDKPQFLHDVKEKLRGLKRDKAAREELDWWNGQWGTATPTGVTDDNNNGVPKLVEGDADSNVADGTSNA